jgi:hypothetical protein
MYWYYVDDRKKVGPVTEYDIELMVRQGKITSDTLVWNEVISRWLTYGKIKAGEA